MASADVSSHRNTNTASGLSWRTTEATRIQRERASRKSHAEYCGSPGTRKITDCDEVFVTRSNDLRSAVDSSSSESTGSGMRKTFSGLTPRSRHSSRSAWLAETTAAARVSTKCSATRNERASQESSAQLIHDAGRIPHCSHSGGK